MDTIIRQVVIGRMVDEFSEPAVAPDAEPSQWLEYDVRDIVRQAVFLQWGRCSKVSRWTGAAAIPWF